MDRNYQPLRQILPRWFQCLTAYHARVYAHGPHHVLHCACHQIIGVMVDEKCKEDASREG